ncbi:phosphoribosylanthranilate isomerase [Helicobacter sp. 23-1044]
MKIKFCGLFRECDIEFANALMPDFVGFVFARQSKRFVDFALAGELKARLNSQIKAVGVFVDSPVERICEAVQSKIIDIVQLHGNENNAYISALRESLRHISAQNPPIIKAINACNSHLILEAQNLNADFVLLDSANAGSGVAFEWEKLSAKIAESRHFAFDFATRFFLAGGVNADNLPRAMSLNPYAIDISSGIESDGKKDFAKMKQIIETLRSQNLR